MEKRPYEYNQYEQFGPSNAQKPRKKQYHEVIGLPVNPDQQQPYVPAYQWLPQEGAIRQPAQPQGYAPAQQQQPRTRATVSQRPAPQQNYAPTQQRVPQGGIIQQPVKLRDPSLTQQAASPAGTTRKPALPKPMPKARALALVSTLKKSLVVASLAAFVSFSGLAAFHQVGTTASKTASASTTSTSSTQTTGKNFLKQSGGNTGGTSSSSSKTTSGSTSSSSSSSGTTSGTSSSTGSSSGTSSSSSSPVSGSNVS